MWSDATASITHEAYCDSLFADFQIPAHFTENTGWQLSAGRRRQPEGPVEDVRKMAVAGESQVERQPGEVRCTCVDVFQCRAETKAVAILMNTHSSPAPEDASQMERRTVNYLRNVIERQVFRKTRG